MHWKKLSNGQISERVFDALDKNINYGKQAILGIPATYLDEEEFYDDAPFLKDSPFLSALIANPNHIGCHTIGGESEPFFKGTQAIEKELIGICAEQIFGGEKDQQDGYVAPGGTEANIQALWIYRNYFMSEFNAKPEEIKVICSTDSHYSMSKGTNLLGLEIVRLPVDQETRQIVQDDCAAILEQTKNTGANYFILVMNLATTMFGSVDDLMRITDLLQEKEMRYMCHVDAAFGGFIYPFVEPDSPFSFQNERITSFTLDGHKMLQSPYGTGIFLIRKGFMQYVINDDAKYVSGLDYTLCGSRSGANAISIWMILMGHGSEGWKYKMQTLIDRTDILCNRLDKKGIRYYRNPHVNIVTMDARDVKAGIAKKYGLVPDAHTGEPKWWKIVMMSHVRKGDIDRFLMEI